MASLSFSSLFKAASLLLVNLWVCEAATVTYDWNITWVQANPDNAFSRATIGINNEWPLPVLRATVGDNIVVNVQNGLGNQSTTLHFHGLFMNGTTHMDGPHMVNQCGIPPGHNFTYNFTIDQPGTYWYHSHAKGQYPDGLRGPLIVTDPNSPYKDKYDEEIILTVSDWYHDQMQDLIPQFISLANPTGAEPIPDNALFNDTQNLTIPVQPGTTYMFRMINIGAFAGQYIWFEGHNMTIIEVDGVYTDEAVAQMIYLGAAQRCSFLITTKNDTSANYAFMASMDTTLFDTVPDGLNYNVTGWLEYDASAQKPAAAILQEFDDYDDFNLVPYDKGELLLNPTQQVNLTVEMIVLDDGANYAFFNNITYTSPNVPTLYTVMSAGDAATNPWAYGEYTHSFVLAHNEVVEIIVNNDDTGKHPFHLHGHQFQAVARSDENAGFYDPTVAPQSTFPSTPMRRDTFVVRPQGYIVLRFRSDNPGVWLFHCHIEWHVDSGLIATMVEAPLELQKNLVIPESHFDNCVAGGKGYKGNAAGNIKDFLDLSGQPKPPSFLPDGFTARGIVAMTFSCVAALLGLAVIVYYGLSDPGAADAARENEFLTTVPGVSKVVG